MIGSIKSSGTNDLLGMLKEIEDTKQNTPEASLRDTPATIALQNSAPPSGASNVMSSNYTSAENGPSPYVAALLNNFGIEKEMKAKSQKDVINNVVPDKVKEAAFWYGDSRMRQAKMLKDAIESNAEVFDEIKENIEENAQQEHTSVIENSGMPQEAGSHLSGNSASAESLEAEAPLPSPAAPDKTIEAPNLPTFEGKTSETATNAAPAQGTGSSSGQGSKGNESSAPPSAPSLDLVV